MNEEERIALALERLKEAQEKQLERSIKLKGQLELQKKILEEQKQLASDISEEMAINQTLREKEIELEESKLKTIKNQIDQILLKKSLGESINQQELDNLVNERKESQKHLAVLGEQNDAIEGFSSKLTNAFSKYTGITGQAETLLGHTFKLVTSGASFSQGLGEALNNIREMATPANIMVALIDTMVQSTLMVAQAQDQAVTSFNKLTGTTGEYTGMITEVAQTNKQFGVSMAEAGAAAGALYTSMSSFSELNKTAKEDILKTTVQLEALGVSSGTTAKNMEIATRSLGMTGIQAKNLQMELFHTAASLGLPPAAVAEGFASAAPQLAKHGSKMVDVFKDLTKASKETGVSTDKLISLTAKFDTFGGAADAAGKLNAVLGGDLLNSMDLLMADEAERIKLLQDTIDNSGKAFHEMNKFEKQAVASAAGITDMTEATAIFNPQMIGMTKAQKDAAERAKAVTTVSKKFQAVLESLAVVVTPLIEIVHSFMNSLLELHDATSTTIGGFKIGLMPILVLIGGGFAALLALALLIVPAILSIVSSLAGLTGAGGAAIPAINLTAGAFQALSVALAQAALPILAVGAALLMMGGGIMLAAMGLAELVSSFKDIGGGAGAAAVVTILGLATAIYFLMPSLIALGPTLVSLATATTVSSGPLVALGAIFLSIGAGIGAAAWGMSMFVSSFAQLGAEITKFNKSVVDLDFVKIAKGYSSIAKSIKEIVESINDLSILNTDAFAAMMLNMELSQTTTGTPVPNTTGPEVAQQIKSAAETNAIAKVDVVAMTVNETQPRETGNQQVTAKLILKEKEIGELLLSGINNPFDKRMNQIVKAAIKPA